MKFPSKIEVYTYLFISIALTLVFTVIYGYTNAAASVATKTYRFYFDWELNIPFVAPMILIYLSLNLLTLLPLFVLNAKQLQKLGWQFLACTLVAGLIFYFFPAEVVFPRSTSEGIWQPIYAHLYALDHPFNSLPSLHITYSYLSVRCLNGPWPQLISVLWIWFALICCSVILTHQHHLLDILAGMILAESAVRVIGR